MTTLSTSVVGVRSNTPTGASAVRAMVLLALAAIAIAGSTGASVRPADHVQPERSGFATAPASLRTAVSSTLGARESAFAVRGQGGVLTARGGGLSTVFAESGPVLRTGHADLGLAFAGLGYGARLSQPGGAVRSVSANEVSYRRAGVTEWYRNGPLGLEQGFVVARRPEAGNAGNRLNIAVRYSGSLRASARGSQVVFANAAGKQLLRYGGLSAIDAAGRSLPARLTLHGRTLLLRIDDSGARYPLTIDPLVQQQGAPLTPTDEIGQGSFGWSVALSADGNTALIGAPHEGLANGGGPGAAWVFVRTGSTWTQQGPKLWEITALFGSAVALSADGNTALISGLNDNNGVGAAWVFTRSGSTWTQQGPKLTANDEAGAGRFGWSVALSTDGDTALIGGFGDNGGVGAAWVFTRSGGAWAQQGAKLTGAGKVGVSQFGFGYSCALSADGNTALVADPDDNNNSGAAWMFTRSGSTWTQQGPKLTPNDEAGSGWFGLSVALTGDGNTALIGGPLDNNITGAAWQFTRSGTSWAQDGTKIVSDGGPADLQGFGLFTELSADGQTALISGLSTSASWVVATLYERSGATWKRDGSLTNGIPGDGLSTEITLSGDGSTVLLGGDHANTYTGEASVFTVSPDPTGGPTGGGGGGAAPDLATTLAAPAQIAQGGQAALTLTVSDLNGALATGIHTTLTLPAGATVAASYSDRGPGCTADTGKLDCNLDFLSGQLVAHVTIFLNLATAGPATLTATTTGAQSDPNPANNTAGATIQVGPTTTPTTPPAPTPKRQPAATNHINGTNRNDHLTGTNKNDVINGGAGNDTIHGGLGNDILTGGPGNDLIYGGPGNDVIHAVDGHKDTIDCGPGHDTVYADKHDRIAKNCETIHRIDK